MPLREEGLLPRHQKREVGDVIVRKGVERIPARLKVDAVIEEVEIRREGQDLPVPAKREQISIQVEDTSNDGLPWSKYSSRPIPG